METEMGPKTRRGPLWARLMLSRAACSLYVLILVFVLGSVLIMKPYCPSAPSAEASQQDVLVRVLRSIQLTEEQRQALPPDLARRIQPPPTSDTSGSVSPRSDQGSIWDDKSSRVPAGSTAWSATSSPPALPASPEPAPVTPPTATTSQGMSSFALLVICYNRPEYLRRTLASVLPLLPAASPPAVFVSQDGAVPAVTALVRDTKTRLEKERPDVRFTHLQHTQQRLRGSNGYEMLARHFGWALGQVFSGGFEHVIILEDDLEVAPDFFGYFAATAPLLDQDPTLLAVSAYNDIGQPEFVAEPARVYRSDFFPGLGWMLNRAGWDELGPKWPDGYWDDWLREPPQRKGRAFLRPEISRTRTFGQQGVSHSQFFSQYLGNIKLNDEVVDWASLDLSYLLKPRYDEMFEAAVNAAKLVPASEALKASCSKGDSPPRAYKVSYRGFDGPGSYPQVAKRFGFIHDVKAQVPRTAYQGTVSFKYNGCTMFIVPET